MGSLLEAFLAGLGMVSGFYALAMLLGQPGPARMQQESEPANPSHAIHSLSEKIAA